LVALKGDCLTTECHSRFKIGLCADKNTSQLLSEVSYLKQDPYTKSLTAVTAWSRRTELSPKYLTIKLCS